MKKVYCIVLAGWLPLILHADLFGVGDNAFSIDFTPIGHAGNTADSATGFGAVHHDCRIGTYEITVEQFARARAADVRISNGNEGLWNDGTRTVGGSAPADRVSALEAMKFCNWLTSGDALQGAYSFYQVLDTTFADVHRDSALAIYGTVYALPTEDEWYKAAYYSPANDGTYSLFANGGNDPSALIHGPGSGWNYWDLAGGYVYDDPNYVWNVGSGGVEQNGTFDMMGNVYEWTETKYQESPIADIRVFRGGQWEDSNIYLRSTSRSGLNVISDTGGFRVVAIPEPSSLGLIAMAGAGLRLFRKRTIRFR